MTSAPQLTDWPPSRLAWGPSCPDCCCRYDLGIAFENVSEERLFPSVGFRTPDEEARGARCARSAALRCAVRAGVPRAQAACRACVELLPLLPLLRAGLAA